MPARLLLAAALATACHATLAQDPAVPPAVSVQRLAPQLVPFAGSEANFQSLVNGLAIGTQVQLFTVLPNGFIQNVEFHADRGADADAGGADPGDRAPAAHRPGNRRSHRGAAWIRADGRSGADRARRHAGSRRAHAEPPNFAEPGGADPGSGQAPAPPRPPPRRASPTASTCKPTPGTASATTAGATGTLPRPSTSDSAIPAGATSRSVDTVDQRQPDGSTPAPPARHDAGAGAGDRSARRGHAPSAFPQAPAPRTTDPGGEMGSVLYLDGRLRRHARVELVRKEKGVERRRAHDPTAQPSPAGLQLLARWRAPSASALLVDARGLFRGVLRTPRCARSARSSCSPGTSTARRGCTSTRCRRTARRRCWANSSTTWCAAGAACTSTSWTGTTRWCSAPTANSRRSTASAGRRTGACTSATTTPTRSAARHHQKIVVIDDAIAFSGGIDLTLRRWDCREHAPTTRAAWPTASPTRRSTT